MPLKPQDVVIVAKVLAGRLDHPVEAPPQSTYAEIALSLGMSVSEVHAGAKRALSVGVFQRSPQAPHALIAQRANFLELVSHGIR
ncbi:MAG: hypothetical protein ACYCWW_05065 [Deltaproteobacteria bacterium]